MNIRKMGMILWAVAGLSWAQDKKSDEGWGKVKELASGQEVRVTLAKALAKPVEGVFDEADDERLVMVVNKKEQKAFGKGEIVRVEARPKGATRVTRTESSTKGPMPMDRPTPAANPGERMRTAPPGTTSESSSGLSVGSKPGYEVVYRARMGMKN